MPICPGKLVIAATATILPENRRHRCGLQDRTELSPPDLVSQDSAAIGVGFQPACELSLKIGSSIASASPPTMTPIPATMIGSSNEVADLIAMPTSES
jgi:hypothetical protein